MSPERLLELIGKSGRVCVVERVVGVGVSSNGACYMKKSHIRQSDQGDRIPKEVVDVLLRERKLIYIACESSPGYSSYRAI